MRGGPDGIEGEGAAMSEQTKIAVPEGYAENAWADEAKYQEMYRRSVDDFS